MKTNNEAVLRRVVHELRTYNPAADNYKGAHIHSGWADAIEKVLAATATVAKDGGPVAWAVFAPDGNCRIWFGNIEDARRWKAVYEPTLSSELTPLYTRPKPEASADDTFMLKREIHNLKRHIEDYCPAPASAEQPAGEAIPLHMSFALRKKLEQNGWTYSGNGKADESLNSLLLAGGFFKHEHPNLSVPIDAQCSAKLDQLGDDRGQGLDGYWKWGFRAGWHHARLAAAPISEDARAAASRNAGVEDLAKQSARILHLQHERDLALSAVRKMERKLQATAPGPVENGVRFCQGCGKPVHIAAIEQRKANKKGDV